MASFLTNTQVVKVEGDSVPRSITYKNLQTGKETTFKPENNDTFGVFVFATGDVCIKTLRQVVTATGDGAIAATEMEKYLSKQREKTGL